MKPTAKQIDELIEPYLLRKGLDQILDEYVEVLKDTKIMDSLIKAKVISRALGISVGSGLIVAMAAGIFIGEQFATNKKLEEALGVRNDG